MREHLFRAKRVDNGKEVEGSLIYGNKINPNGDTKTVECVYICWAFYDSIKCYAEVIPETVGEFTGLTDKNGKRIFEGDILSIETYVGESTNPTWKNVTEHEDTLFATYYCTRRDEAIVRFNQYKCEFDLKVYNSGRYKRISKFKKVSLEYYHAEIIGNIHDNPELLEVKE